MRVNFEENNVILKSLQNKKGLTIFQLPTFWCFSQLPAVEKDTKKWAAGKFLGPSYFEATLGNSRTVQNVLDASITFWNCV